MWLVLLGVVLLLGGLYAVGYLLSDDRVPRGVSVAGVDVGGMSPDEAKDTLERELSPRLDEPVRLRHRSKTYRIVPSKAGLSLDLDETVAATGAGKSLNPLRMIGGLTTDDTDVDPVVSVDDDALDPALKRVARKVDRDPVEGEIRFNDGRPKPVHPRPGRQLDRTATSDALRGAALDRARSVDLAMEDMPSRISDSDVEKALTEFARPAMSGPVVVEVGRRSVRLSPATIGKALSVRARDGELTPRLGRKRLKRAAGQRLDQLVRRPRPATVKLRGGKPRVIPRKVGTTVKTRQLAEDIQQVLTESGDDRTVQAKTRKEKPKFSTRDARRLRIKEVVSEFTTEFPHSSYRNTNLGRAAERINGTVLKPDETFSFNDTVGERTAENGFTKGYIIDEGALVEDFGGGVSQVATTVYNAAFFAGLKDVEHHPHSLYFDRYPIGREATVAWGSLDLQFENNTPYGVLIESWIEPSSPSGSGRMHVRMWSTEYWKVKAGRSDRHNKTSPGVRYDTSDDCEPQTGIAGFDIDIHRYLERDGERVRTETDEVTYDAADTVRCKPKPD